MKLILAGLFILAVGTHAQWYHFPREAAQGAGDMWRAHNDMKEANLKGSEDYYQARGNHEAAQRGPGGKWMAEVISDAREKVQGKRGRGRRDHDNQGGGVTRGNKDSDADQEANRWGRNGGDPNVYRPKGLPSKY
ncbi:hypothetical protein NHX12_017281 [Muraenolepis orangiensis]|uniref:Serum amyloid A protein n=1 Tax=Muraenolepis orangiensis TaxID=630683 RepID=A0A9Q0D3L0_9TELE|nr:hypothetical protein NHX12_017281 [Muraenolepis orangiensis]